MENKKEIQINISTFFLILSIIALIIMGIYIYELNTARSQEIQKSEEFKTKVNNLSGTINSLQEKIDSISNTTVDNNTTISDQTNNISQSNISKNTTNNSTSNSNSDSISSTSKDTVKNRIIGNWKASKVVDSNGNDLGLNSIWGSGISYSNKMVFKENGNLSYLIGITPTNDDGSYTVSGNTINCGIPTDVQGELTWKTLTYIPDEDILKEDLYWSGEKQTVTYVRAN